MPKDGTPPRGLPAHLAKRALIVAGVLTAAWAVLLAWAAVELVHAVGL